MLETQRRVSTENLEAQKLVHLAAKENKESVMLETYRSLLMQDTTVMAEDVRSEHVLALRCMRENLFMIMVFPLDQPSYYAFLLSSCIENYICCNCGLCESGVQITMHFY
jgi:hypothetical protein